MEAVLIGSIVSALSTGLGAVPILFVRNLSHRWRDILLALTAGVMMAACTSSLIPQALADSNFVVLGIGLLLGTVTLTILERSIPHMDLEHTKTDVSFDSKAMLIVAAITLHNLPEGLSVGVSYASDNQGLGPLIALAIGLQNFPEGFLVALFVAQTAVSPWVALGVATLTGAVEIITSLLGFYLTRYIEGLVPYGLSFAAGAMLFIIYKELIPESHGDGHEMVSTYAFIFGILLMLMLIHYFG